MICTTCKIDKLKTKFSLRSDTGKLRRQCRDCRRKVYQKSWARYSKLNRKKINKHALEYYHTNSKKINEKIKQWRKDNPEIYRKIKLASDKQQKSKYPERIKARCKARHTNGIKKDNCENCFKEKNLQLHHEDYLKPLKVITLCRECHTALHYGSVVVGEIVE
ncbi:hypothetical protein LCGC14_2627760 [marine sediment metagenome]|uniref:HNH domain-containing protein n=1 Tax=marine sediment metagenome TaxID=412755 RepID=A0A0F9ANT4_9ZZZZ